MYSYEEALKSSIDYFKGDELAAKVFIDKYALRDREDNILEDTPEKMHRRLAREFARIEKDKFKEPLTEAQIFSLFDNFKYIIPQGSPMFGIGNKYQYVSVGNCFVLPPPNDSYLSINYLDTQIAQISSRRGGVGWDISNLRPVGMPVQNAAKTTTGAISFMNRFSNTIREVCQCIHGDSLVLSKTGLKKIKDVIALKDYVWTKNGWILVNKLIHNKRKRLYKVTTNTGYSIITSKDHIFQTFDNDGNLTETKLENLESGDGIVLCKGEFNSDKDYLLLIDPEYKNINRKPANCVLPSILNDKLAYLLGFSYGNGSTDNDSYLELAISNDYPEVQNKLQKYIKEIFDYDCNLINGDGDLKKLRITNKTVIQFLKANNILKEKAKTLIFPELILSSNSIVQRNFIAGYFDADGDNAGKKGGYRFRSICSDFLCKLQIVLSTYGILSKISYEDRQNKGWNNLYSLAIVGTSSTHKFVENFKTLSTKVDINPYVSKMDCWISPFKAKSFGLKRTKKINYCSGTDFVSMQTLERLKNDNYNVITTLAKDTIDTIEFIDYDECYDLCLNSEHLFWCNGIYVHNSGRRGASLQSISVHHPEIMEFIKCKRNTDKITGSNITVQFTDEFMNAVIENKDYEQRWPINNPKFKRMVSAREVWNEFIISARDYAEPGACYIDIVHKESTGYHHGEIESSSNPCGEQYLPPFSSCRLIAINLYSYVLNPFTKDAKFNYELFYEHCKIMQRLADDIVDLELECIDRIINKIKSDPEPQAIKQIGLDLWKNIKDTAIRDRRSGCGFTGLGDCLAALNIKYGSDESINTTEEIQKSFKFAAFESSVDMAEELGSFPNYEWNNDIESEFIKRLNEENPQLCERMKRFGRRNMVLLTIAPTGSVSCLTQTTSGLEPAFLLEYTRRKKVNPNDKNVKVDFIDQSGDSWQEFLVRHKGLQDFINITGKTLQDSPYFGATANEINWVQKTKLQGVLQKHIDNSISVTTNLPNDVSYEEVEKIYLESWKNGCKGCTVYRDGCRTGVLVTKKEEPKAGINYQDAPKRPKILPCDIYNISVNKEKYTVIVGLLEGKPYEVFCIKEYIDKHKTGQLEKGKGGYSLHTENDTLILSSFLDNDVENALLRLISTSLRHGANIQFIVEQLLKTEGSLTSFTKSIARALKKYIENKDIKGTCPECGQETLVYQEGCISCKSCGYSKCS